MQIGVTNLVIKIAKKIKNSDNIDENSYLFGSNEALLIVLA